MTDALTLHLESAERQLAALSEQITAMKARPSSAVLGNLAVDAELAAVGLSHTLGAIFGLAADDHSATVVSIRSRMREAPRLYAVGSEGCAA